MNSDGITKISLVLLGLMLGALVTGAQEGIQENGAQETEWKVPSRAARKRNPVPDNAAAIAQGKTVFEAQCVSCHGATGVGDGVAAKDLEKHPGDLTNAKVQAQSDGALFWKITTGRAPMTAFGETLSAKERWQVVRYIRTLGGGPPIAEPEFDTREPLRMLLNALVKPYDQLRSALAQGKKDMAGEAVPDLRTALTALQAADLSGLEEELAGAWKKSLTELSDTMKGLHDPSDLASMRGSFKGFSAAAEKAWARFGHGQGGPLYVFECSKATAAGPARWVQTTAKPENPYLGAEKVSCVKLLKGIAATRKKHK